MAQHASAKKRHRQSLKRRSRNRHSRSTVRNTVRKLRQAAERGDPEAPALFARAERLLRKASSQGVMHSRTVSRTVSRLHKLVNAKA